MSLKKKGLWLVQPQAVKVTLCKCQEKHQKNFYERVKGILKVNMPCDDLEIQVKRVKL